MNLYIRYFDNETFCYSVDEAVDFLASIPEIGMNADLEADIRAYAASDVFFPKRYKIRPRVYFIIIKTTAACMADFKDKKALHPMPAQGSPERIDPVAELLRLLNEQRPGWYEGDMLFKRVIMSPINGKFEYKDTRYVVRCKANSGLDCYNRMVDSLQGRVDERSQFPSVKGGKFKFQYLGMWK